MPLSAKTVRAQLAIMKPLLNACSLNTIRKAQNKIGELMEARQRQEVITRTHPFANFTGG